MLNVESDIENEAGMSLSSSQAVKAQVAEANNAVSKNDLKCIFILLIVFT